MVESALTFNEHDIHLITKELQGSPDNTPIKDTLFQKKDLQSELLEFRPDFCNMSINDILDSCPDKNLTKSQILLIIIILGNFKPKIDKMLNMRYEQVIAKRILNSSLHYPNPFVTYYLLRYIQPHCKLAVYWHLDITKQKILKHFFNGQNKKLIARSSKILGATPVHVNESAYSEIMGAKKYVLPYAIDEKRLVISDDEIKVAMEIRKKYEGKILGFFIGRHVPYKGLQYLLEASACMRGDKMHFLIAGTGELTQELKTLSANDSKVEFVGRVTDSQWRSYLYACDIFCFPSITRNEGFGLAQAEAMYYGKPVVTFTIPGSGVNFVTQNGITGIECPNSDSMAYADALLRLANDPELRKKMGDAGRQRVLDNFTEAQFVKNVGKLLDDVL